MLPSRSTFLLNWPLRLIKSIHCYVPPCVCASVVCTPPIYTVGKNSNNHKIDYVSLFGTFEVQKLLNSDHWLKTNSVNAKPCKQGVLPRYNVCLSEPVYCALWAKTETFMCFNSFCWSSPVCSHFLRSPSNCIPFKLMITFDSCNGPKEVNTYLTAYDDGG